MCVHLLSLFVGVLALTPSPTVPVCLVNVCRDTCLHSNLCDRLYFASASAVDFERQLTITLNHYYAQTTLQVPTANTSIYQDLESEYCYGGYSNVLLALMLNGNPCLLNQRFNPRTQQCECLPEKVCDADDACNLAYNNASFFFLLCIVVIVIVLVAVCLGLYNNSTAQQRRVTKRVF